MFTTDGVLQVYRDLADYHERQGLDQLRDRFLVLAAAAAQSGGRGDEADRLRQRLLQGNANHALRPFPSMAQALNSPDIQTFVEELRQEYPLHAAEDLLASVRGREASPPPRRSTRALPPTAPVIDLDGLADTLKVFPTQDEANVPILPAWQDPPPHKTSFPSARPVKLLPVSASARPATRVIRRATELESPARTRPPSVSYPDGTEETSGRWVGSILFLIVLAAALCLAGMTLLQPFVP